MPPFFAFREKVRPLFTGRARVEKLAWAMQVHRGRQGEGETFIYGHSPGRETGLGHAGSDALQGEAGLGHAGSDALQGFSRVTGYTDQIDIYSGWL